MKTSRIASTVLALAVASAIMMGCQNSSPVTVGGSQNIVRYAGIQIPGGASLAITVDVQKLPNATRKLMAMPQPSASPSASGTASPSASGAVTSLVCTVTCENPPFHAQQTISVADCESAGGATWSFTNLPDGNYTVSVEALDAAGQIVKVGTQSATIANGSTAVVPITCQDANGSINVNWTCSSDLCGATPTPAPTATPTPTPPANPSSSMSFISTFEVDANGNIFLVGSKEGQTASSLYSSTTQATDGRIIEVSSDLGSMSTEFDNTEIVNDAAIHGSTMYPYLIYFNGIQRIDISSNPGTEITPKLPGVGYTDWVNASTSNGQILFNSCGGSHVLVNSCDPATPSTYSAVVDYDSGGNDTVLSRYNVTRGLTVDSLDRPIWPANAGICIPGITPTSVPTVLTATDDTWAQTLQTMAKVQTPSTAFLATAEFSQTDHSVYYWDAATPTAHNVALDMSPNHA